MRVYLPSREIKEFPRRTIKEIRSTLGSFDAHNSSHFYTRVELFFNKDWEEYTDKNIRDSDWGELLNVWENVTANDINRDLKNDTEFEYQNKGYV
jgi:hypothetical protein